MSANNVLFAWVCDDRGKGDEIIAAMPIPEMTAMPLVTSHLHIAQHFRQFAAAHGRATRKPVKLIKFKMGDVIDVIIP